MATTNKVILTTDWHFGARNGEEAHNQDLLHYADWVIETAKAHGASRLFHLGDFFDGRNKIDLLTLHYATKAARKLYEAFGQDNVIVLEGNHDLMRRDTRAITSLECIRPYVTLIDEIVFDDDCVFVPWVVNQEEWDWLVNTTLSASTRFMFGHMEFSQFKMNDHYVMEHGYSHKAMKHIERIFTGHYHMRQEKDNVVYIGNPFGFNFNDANDSDRGCCVLDQDSGEYTFVNYTDGVQVESVDYKSVLAGDVDLNASNRLVRIVINESVDEKTMGQLEELVDASQARETKVVNKVSKANALVENDAVADEIEEVENIDRLVVQHIQGSDEIEGVDKDLLIELFNQAQTGHIEDEEQ